MTLSGCRLSLPVYLGFLQESQPGPFYLRQLWWGEPLSSNVLSFYIEKKYGKTYDSWENIFIETCSTKNRLDESGLSSIWRNEGLNLEVCMEVFWVRIASFLEILGTPATKCINLSPTLGIIYRGIRDIERWSCRVVEQAPFTEPTLRQHTG